MGDFTSFNREIRKDLGRWLLAVVVALLCVVAAAFLTGCADQQPLTWDKLRALFAQAPTEAVAEPAPAAAPLAPAPARQQLHQDPPRASLAYRDDLIRTARAVWGMEAPVAVFAAQIHQESAWNPRAVSKVGAAGLAQFMPATTRWIAKLDPDLADAQPYNPAWAMRALVFYDQWLHERTPARFSAFDRMWVVLRGYNGGLGHWQAEAAASGAAKPTRLQVDDACGRAKRSASHCPENLGYPHRILQVHQVRYLRWGSGL